jgi:hypothetical protein
VNWTVFYIVFCVAFLASSPAFAALNALGVRLRQVPPSGAKTWYGRPFVHWREETTLFVADPFFLSLLMALYATACLQLDWTPMRIVWASAPAILSVIGTTQWLRSVPKAEREGKLRTWGWHWSGPGARTTIAGYWHAVYYLVQATVAVSALCFLTFQPEISIHHKMGMVFAGAGYVMSLFHHQHLEKVRGHSD